ncbi:MAG: nicotinate-nucleotide--dimethylbenzimidazole phosphoribosyltransferase [Pseudomonadota bacterium]|nr:nicotinate-nucleotide--dimethylbenzimidazole phosphoribosyltransferase [Pseudomonadota bacterium]MDE3038387.1 nicotinate-nucleotide--dimethylbenzimidazole phosphoribosyltransferase [Pseudomonadota bacterium]
MENPMSVLSQRADDALPAFDRAMEAQARRRLDSLTKPQGSLGRLEDIAAWMCGWQQTLTPRTEKAYTIVFAGNHGVTKQGVSAFPSAVTAQMVANFAAGGAAINQLCNAIPSTLRVIPLSLEKPTRDFTEAPAMSAEECAEAFEIGKQAVPADADILILGEMGIGNTTAAAAVAHAVVGGNPEDWVGAGTGVNPQALAHKREVVADAVRLHRSAMIDALSTLQHVGGRELVAMAGAIWQARRQRIPVILDGYVVTAAAVPLCLDAPDALAHCLAGHLSVEPGHRRLLEWLGTKPVLELGMRLGEGSGAQVALAVVRAAVATFTHMATFAEAAVATKEA